MKDEWCFPSFEPCPSHEHSSWDAEGGMLWIQLPCFVPGLGTAGSMGLWGGTLVTPSFVSDFGSSAH